MAAEGSSRDPRTELAQVHLETLLEPHLVRPVTDVGFGEGYSLEIGSRETPVELQVFPDARGVIIASETVHVELAPIISVSGRGEQLGLVSESAGERSMLQVSRFGGVLFTRQAMTEAEEPQEPEASGPQERRTIRGRVGRTPRFRTTKGRGVVVGQFPLAEHTGENDTTWHTILVFGERAQRLKDKPVVTGQEIEIVGYPHGRARRTRDGGARQVTELYATAIRTTLKDVVKSPAEDE